MFLFSYLGGTGNHVLDKVTVTGGIDNGDVELGGLKLPQSDIDGDTTLTLSLIQTKQFFQERSGLK